MTRGLLLKKRAGVWSAGGGCAAEAWLQGPGIQSVPPYLSLGPILAAGVWAAGWARDRFPIVKVGAGELQFPAGIASQGLLHL